MKILNFLLPVILILLSACSKENSRHYDAQKLLANKCAKCHNLAMPPKTYEDEKAPPMMAVAFHIKDFMPVRNPADKKPKFIAFVTDYVLHPAAAKSFCDKQSLESYGLMPSQKGKISRPELEAISEYIYDTYTKEIFLQKMEEANAFARLPKGERLARQNGCFSCHAITRQKVGPSFLKIAGRYRDTERIAKSIKNGSRGKWKESRNIPMPARNDLNTSVIEALASWILEQKKH